MLITIIELPEYYKRAATLLNETEKQAVIDYLAEHPKVGSLIVGTGGLRKLRWGRGVKGKSSGVRIVYYYHNETIPLFLITIFGKNERANLSKTERNSLAKMVDTLVKHAMGYNYD